MKKTGLKLRLAAFMLCAALAAGVTAGCKVTRTVDPPVATDTVRIAVVAKGYGEQWAKDLCKAFEEETGKKAQVTKIGTDDSLPGNSVKLGPNQKEKEMIDIFFPTENFVHSQLSQKFISGYDGTTWADLTSVYESPAVGYKELEANPDLKIKDIVDPTFYKAFTYKDDKQYLMSYATSVCGMLYNKTLWDATNAKLAAAGQAEITLPRTTQEMTALFETIKGMPNTISTAYPYSYSGLNDYTEMVTLGWWAQYDGKEAVDLAVEGRYKNTSTGVITYSPEIFNTNGRLHAFSSTMRLFGGGNTDPQNAADDFHQAQLKFLDGKAFFHVNGDWMERETSSSYNPGEVEVEYIKLPIVSEIINHPAITANDTINEAKLRDIVGYIDGNLDLTAEIPSGQLSAAAAALGVHASTVARIAEARKFNGYGQGTARVAHVTPYTPRLDDALDFLKFMYSKKGQEVMMKAAYGTMCPIKVDMTQFDYFNNKPTAMSKSKIVMFQESYPIEYASNGHAMQYLGGLSLVRFNGQRPSQWTNAASVRTSEYNGWNGGDFAAAMSRAGVKND